MRLSLLPVLALALAPTAEAAPQRPDPAAERRPEVWAVVAGVQRYEDPKIPACRGSVRDARELAETLRGFAGPSHVALLHDDGADAPGLGGIRPQTILAPTRANLERATREWLGQVARPGDLVLIFFAGQAASVGGKPVLLPSDARTDDLAGTGWTPEAAVDELAGVRRCQVVCWLDTSTRGRGRAVPGGDADPAATDRLLYQLARWPGAAAWIAADDRPSPEGQPSPFVEALRRGLGTRPEPLLACLASLRRDPAMQAQGFRARGGLPPWLSLRPSEKLRRQFEPALLLQRGHSLQVNAVVLTADGDRMATASADSTVRLWQVSGAEPILLDLLDEHTNGVSALALGEDGRYLLSGDGNGVVRGRDLADGVPVVLQDLAPHHEAVMELVAGPDGSTFLSRDFVGDCVLWRVEGKQLRPEPWLSGVARALAASPRGGAWAFAAATAEAGGPVLLRAADATGRVERVEGTGAPASALALSAEGLLAVGDEAGRLVVRDLAAEGRPAVLDRTFEGEPVRLVRLGPGGLLAVGSGEGVRLGRVGPDAEPARLPGLDGAVVSLAFSADGRWLGACTEAGDLAAWDLADPADPRPVALAVDEASAGDGAGAARVAFSADGRSLVVGATGGGIWRFELPEGQARTSIPASRGQVRRLAVRAEPAAPPGRREAVALVEVDADARARLWNLRDGRGPRPLPGLWVDGAFVPPSGDRLAMIRDPADGGGLTLVDASTGLEVEGVAFEPPPSAPGQAPRDVNDLARLAVSPDGAWVAASTTEGRERVFVWPIGGGPSRELTSHLGTINDLSFAKGGGRTVLATASDDGAVRLWVVAGPGASLDEPAASLRPRPEGNGRPAAVTASALDPTGRPRLAAAYWAPDAPPSLVLWSWTWADDGRPTRPRPLRLGQLDGRAHALAFGGEGGWVVAGGDGRRLQAWRLGERPEPVRLPMPEGRPHHAERINALVAWPGAGGPPMLASGSDDTTVRLWRLDDEPGPAGPLVGTLVAAAQGPEGAEEWVAFTPTGDFEASRAGDRLVRFVVDREVRPLEQFSRTFYRFGLTERLRLGERPEPLALPDPPLLGIDPPDQTGPAARVARIRITLAEPHRLDLEALRLYQNGVPVKSGPGDLKVGPDGRTLTAEVPLRHGLNRFYAMAAQRDAPGVDARSGDVEVDFPGFEEPARTHVVALGVSRYERNALRFAHSDAESLAAYLHEHGQGGAADGALLPGELHVLTNEQVNARAVEDAFTAIRHATRNRPQDTVVVFLAGHTDLLPGPSGRRFSLLLPSFPFPEDAPLLVSNRGVGVAGGRDGPALPRDAYLPFREIYRELPHLDAMNRLIIVDACQAEAVLDDPGARQIRESMATDAREVRNSYLLAARYGEPAGEDPVLQHGLLTYVLLWGLGDASIPAPRGAEPDWRDAARNADLDGDRTVTTEELRSFVERHLPALNANLPELAQRAGMPLPAGRGRDRLGAQAAEAPFPILALPDDATAAVEAP